MYDILTKHPNPIHLFNFDDSRLFAVSPFWFASFVLIASSESESTLSMYFGTFYVIISSVKALVVVKSSPITT